VPRATWDTLRRLRALTYPAITVCGHPFQSVQLAVRIPCWSPATPEGPVLPVWPVPRSLAATSEITSFSVPGVTEMFHFTPCCLAGLCISPAMTGFYAGRVVPFGDPRIAACYGFPWLIAAYHVLHRLLAPRHSPYALRSLIAKPNHSDRRLARSGGKTQRTAIALEFDVWLSKNTTELPHSPVK